MNWPLIVLLHWICGNTPGQLQKKIYGLTFDVSLLVEPTSPLRLPADLERTLFCVVREGHPAAVTVSRTPAHYTPHKTLITDSSGNLAYFMGSEGIKFHNRQSIPPFYHRNGVCYAVTRKYLMEDGLILEGACPVVLDRPLVNIDDMLELEIANWLMERQSKVKE